jgi:hypothetical protein
VPVGGAVQAVSKRAKDNIKIRLNFIAKFSKMRKVLIKIFSLMTFILIL